MIEKSLGWSWYNCFKHKIKAWFRARWIWLCLITWRWHNVLSCCCVICQNYRLTKHMRNEKDVEYENIPHEGGKMPTPTILEERRDKLIREIDIGEHPKFREGKIEGILDMYNEVKAILLHRKEGADESKRVENEPNV